MFTSVDDTLLRADALTLLCCRDADLEKDNAALSKQCRALLSVVRVPQRFFREIGSAFSRYLACQVGKLKARLEHHVNESIQIDQADTSMHLDAEDRDAIAAAHAAEQASEFDPVWEFEWSRNVSSDAQPSA